MIRKIDSNIFSLTILKVTTFSRIRQWASDTLAKSDKKTPIWLIYKEYFSQIELKNIDLAKVSFDFSNNYRIFAP